MNNLYWYQKKQEEKAELKNKNEITLINQELKRILQQLQSFINRNEYEIEAKKANRHLVQSSIWNVNYRNNMESSQVAVEQAILIQSILSNEQDNNKAKNFKAEVERHMRRLGNLDSGVYSKYRRDVQHLL